MSYLRRLAALTLLTLQVAGDVTCGLTVHQ